MQLARSSSGKMVASRALRSERAPAGLLGGEREGAERTVGGELLGAAPIARQSVHAGEEKQNRSWRLGALIAGKGRGGLEMPWRARHGTGRGQRRRRQWRNDASAVRCRETRADRWAGPL
jgi:hypothetical protein